MSCTDPVAMQLPSGARAALLAIARASVSHGFDARAPLPVDRASLRGPLAETRGSFVGVYHGERLRGCVGNLAATTPLAEDVARNAFHAAFRDRRFAPLDRRELPAARIEVSVLSEPQLIEAAGADELHRQLQPGVDGLILVESDRRATFLPKVWEQLPDPAEFIRALKQKAGLPADYWSASLRFERYRASSFTDA